MSQIQCPQCGTTLIPDAAQRVRCLMCGWGGQTGIDSQAKTAPAVKYVASKSVRWKLMTVSLAIIAILVIPSAVAYPFNQWRANQTIAKAKSQMNMRLYASAAKTLNSSPSALTLSSKSLEVKKLLVDNVRWARDISNVKEAKKSLVETDPDLALAELSDIEEDYPHEEEVIDLIDLAQDQIIDPDLEVSLEEVDEIAFAPEDPDAEILEELEKEQGIASEEIEAADQTAPTPEAPGGETEIPESLEDELVIEEIGLSPDEEIELEDVAEPEEMELSEPAPPGPAPGKTQLRDFYHLYNSGSDDHMHTTDVNNEVNPGRDKRTGGAGYGNYGSIGKLYNRKVKKYNKRIVPLYRYYSAARKDHFYTNNRNFSSSSPQANYQRQLVAGYMGKYSSKKSKCLAGKRPIYNIYHKPKQKNYITSDVNEVNRLKAAGWKNSQIIGCIW